MSKFVEPKLPHIKPKPPKPPADNPWLVALYIVWILGGVVLFAFIEVFLRRLTATP